MKSNQPTQLADDTRKAGRGVLSITASKLYFIVAGYAVQLALPRFFGAPEAFGLYATTMSVVSIVNNVLIVATIQTVSKRVSEDLPNAPATLRQGIWLQLFLGGLLGGSLLLCAPALAEGVLLDPLMTPLFRITSLVVFCYALYAALVGSLNGRQMFQRQAGLDMTFTTLRTAGILGAAALGFGVAGALSGFAGAALVLLMVALATVGAGGPAGRIAWKRWLVLMAPLGLYHLCLNLTLQVDLTVLKRTVTALGLEASVSASAAAEVASKHAGFYRAAQTFAFVPYQLILSVTFVVFPMVSKAVSDGDLEMARRYIRGALRFSLLMLLALAAPISGAASGVMRLAYPDAYLAGSGALSVLALGMVCFALFVIAATVLNSAGHARYAASVAAVAVVVVIAANLTLVRMVGIGDQTLIAAATGTSMGTALALIAVAVAVYRHFGAFILPLTACRAVLAAAVGFWVAHALPHDTRVLALPALIAGAIAYSLALLVLREIGRDDVEAVRRVLRPGAGAEKSDAGESSPDA